MSSAWVIHSVFVIFHRDGKHFYGRIRCWWAFCLMIRKAPALDAGIEISLFARIKYGKLQGQKEVGFQASEIKVPDGASKRKLLGSSICPIRSRILAFSQVPRSCEI